MRSEHNGSRERPAATDPSDGLIDCVLIAPRHLHQSERQRHGGAKLHHAFPSLPTFSTDETSLPPTFYTSYSDVDEVSPRPGTWCAGGERGVRVAGGWQAWWAGGRRVAGVVGG